MTTSQTFSLEDFSTCEISDALIKLGSPNGGHIPDIKMLSRGSFCGPSYTVKMVFTTNNEAPKLSEHFVDTVPTNAVIIIDAPLEAKNAVWGGLMSAGAQAKGAQGVVISGRCRDVGEHRKLGFPVFARAQSTVGQSPFTRPSEINIPLNLRSPDADRPFAEVIVNPGDWTIGDEDGVVCVPKNLEVQVVELAVKGREIDALCMKDIQAGKGVQASFKLHRGK